MAARVEKLEAANRRWKPSSVIALLSVISMLLLSARHAERVAAAARPDRLETDVLHVRTVEAQNFVLKDLDGHVYGRWDITSSSTPMDQNGRSVRLYDMPVIKRPLRKTPAKRHRSAPPAQLGHLAIACRALRLFCLER